MLNGNIIERVKDMTQKEKEDLIEILKNHSIENGIKWFVVDRYKNILGFKTKPFVDKKGKEWKSLDNQHPIFYANFNQKVSDWKTIIINLDDLNSNSVDTWSKYLDITINEKLNDVYDSIADMLKTVLGGKAVCICDSYSNVMPGYVASVNREDKRFDFTTDDGEIKTLYFQDMYLGKSPFCDNGEGVLYISMNIRME